MRWDDVTYPEDEGGRPWGWSLCRECGRDCEEEDYDEDKQVSTCPSCLERQSQSDEERLRLEVFVRR